MEPVSRSTDAASFRIVFRELRVCELPYPFVTADVATNNSLRDIGVSDNREKIEAVEQCALSRFAGNLDLTRDLEAVAFVDAHRWLQCGTEADLCRNDCCEKEIADDDDFHTGLSPPQRRDDEILRRRSRRSEAIPLILFGRWHPVPEVSAHAR